MKLRVVFAVASIAAVLAALPARADEHGKRGDYDEHRNGSRSITRIGSHGMTTGKTTITGMVIELIQGAEHPVVISPSR